MLDFSNTEVAFASKSNKDLKRAYWLFKLVEKPSMVNLGASLTKVALGMHLPIKGMVKRTIFAQFCGGESVADCNDTIKELGKYNVGTILDYSVEGKESEEDFDNCFRQTIKTIELAKTDSNIPFSVFKVTGIARFTLLEKLNDKTELNQEEREEYLRVIKRLEGICKCAFENKVPIFIDAEESWIQDAIDQMANSMMAQFNKEQALIYNTAQLYRHDRLEFLKKSHIQAKQQGYFLGMKLVRGAYMEKERERAKEKGYPSPIQPDKAASDRDYDLAVEYCVENINDIAICAGTHNEESSKLLAELIEKKGIDKNHPHLFFAQLLGMSDHISYNVANAGYNVAKYVPYGPVKEVLPYLIRRAQENTSVAGQTGRELSLINTEIARRKKQ